MIVQYDSQRPFNPFEQHTCVSALLPSLFTYSIMREEYSCDHHFVVIENAQLAATSVALPNSVHVSPNTWLGCFAFNWAVRDSSSDKRPALVMHFIGLLCDLTATQQMCIWHIPYQPVMKWTIAPVIQQWNSVSNINAGIVCVMLCCRKGNSEGHYTLGRNQEANNTIESAHVIASGCETTPVVHFAVPHKTTLSSSSPLRGERRLWLI